MSYTVNSLNGVQLHNKTVAESVAFSTENVSPNSIYRRCPIISVTILIRPNASAVCSLNPLLYYLRYTSLVVLTPPHNSPKMSTILRTLRNLRKIGIKEYAHQMQYIGDTKAGTYIATDKYGNKYYENLDQELPRLSFSVS